ncbi:MAG: hypothetical protein MJ175_04500, partial [Clostridia bacterium]|nr:hypothetical protein [Clostridia bacterium]
MKRNLPALLLSLLCVFLCLILVSCKGSSGGASKPAPTGDETLDLLNSVSAGLAEKLAGYY